MRDNSCCDCSKLELWRQEHRQVKYLLESLGMEKSLVPELIHWQRSRYNDAPRLTFAAFNKFVPTFPIYLGYRQRFKLDRNASCTLVAILKKPEKSLFFESWREFSSQLDYRDLPGSRPVGVVFPYGGLPGGLVIYNGFFRPRGTVIRQRIVQFQTSQQTFTIQRYEHMLAAIKDSGWAPGGPPDWPEERIPLSQLLRQVKGALQKLVLGLFVDILNGDVEKWPDWAARVELIQRFGGERWITLTHQEIGDALGLEVHQMRRALRSLQAAGMIKHERHGVTNAYSVIG